MRSVWSLVVWAVLAAGVAVAATPQFLKAEELRRTAAERSQAGDHAGAATALREALKLRPGHPGILLALASQEGHVGDGENAMTHLQMVATMGLTAEIGDRPEFLFISLKPRFIGARVRMEMNAEPVGAPVKAFTLGDGAALFEGLAIDGAQAFAGSVRERRIVRIEGGVASPFVAPGAGGVFSIYGIAVDARRGLLWAASAAGPMTPDLAPGELGAAGLFAFDLKTGAPKQKVLLPPEVKAVLGDLVIAADGTIYASDGGNAAIWRLKPGADALERVFDDPRFVSPQGLVLSDDQRTLIVADYAMGLYAINLETGKMTSISASSGITALGIDGLCRADDGTLVAVQNGISPQRVVTIRLDEEISRIAKLQVIAANSDLHGEPTLCATSGPSVFYIANAPWARFDGAGKDIGSGPFPEAIVAKTPIAP